MLAFLIFLDVQGFSIEDGIAAGIEGERKYVAVVDISQSMGAGRDRQGKKRRGCSDVAGDNFGETEVEEEDEV